MIITKMFFFLRVLHLESASLPLAQVMLDADHYNLKLLQTTTPTPTTPTPTTSTPTKPTPTPPLTPTVAVTVKVLKSSVM
ncbi:hypothetical protein VIGAN_01514600 [Vigna angularis var. angularis]|uniref:Uncharacterized protein n=1 Tax=Vigna angularis var. angularis TaxID=157739 RepID=A0A0S3R8Z0_PHAAN|nr:hypothetical protein VIGAN_01514600 [Vigna angularis var. angularis]